MFTDKSVNANNACGYYRIAYYGIAYYRIAYYGLAYDRIVFYSVY